MASVKIDGESGWSDQDEHVNLVPEYDANDQIFELDPLAGIIARLEMDYEEKAALKPEHSVVDLDKNGETDSGPFSVLPNEPERRDVVDHDKDAHAALIIAIEADRKEWEVAWKRVPKMTLEDLQALHCFD